MKSESPISEKKRPEPDDHVSEYLKSLKRRNFAARTIDGYQWSLKIFSRWITKPIEQATLADLEGFVIHLTEGKQSPASRSNFVKTFRSFYGWLERERHILKSPAANLQYPKRQKRIHRDILTAAELQRFITRPDATTATGMRDTVLLRLLALSGLRRAEACGLNLNDVDLKQRELRITGKGAVERVAFIDTDTRQIIARYLVHARTMLAGKRETALLIANKGKRLSSNMAWAIVVARRKRRSRIPKNITPHSLRRTFATLLLRAGCNLKVISELMGHRLLSSTADYQRLDIADLTRVYQQAHPLAGE